MATVYSLVCFGGLSGKTVTFTDAGDVVNLTNHGLRQGVTGIVFSTTGSLPTGITAGTTYYPRDGADDNKFTIYPTKADAMAGTNQVTFTGTGSGTHTVKSANMLSADLSRYGDTLVYDSLYSMNNARSAVLLYGDEEIVEIIDAFTEYRTGTTLFSVKRARATITTLVNGVRSEGFHAWKQSSGYILLGNHPQNQLELGSFDLVIDGISVTYNSSSSSANMAAISQNTGGVNCTVRNCLITSPGTGNIRGISIGTGMKVYNNVIAGLNGSAGVAAFYTGGGAGSLVYNNLAAKNDVGFLATSTSQGIFFNNISVGNTVNWGFRPAYTAAYHANNAGEPTDKVSFTASAGSSTLTFASDHGYSIGLPISFQTTGSLPTVNGVSLDVGTVYYVKTVPTTTTMTIAATSGGTALMFDGIGSGTHTMSLIWGSGPTQIEIDISSPGTVFADYANDNFAPSGSSSPLVNSGTAVALGWTLDGNDNPRPNYEPSVYPNEVWDIGPFEFDHGNGLAPLQVTLSISGMAKGSVMAVYKTSDGSAIISPTTIGATGSYSITYSYTGDTQITVVVRKGSSGTKYLPYSAPGLITSAGFALIVNQVIDGVLNG